MVWMQGGRDARDERMAKAYKDNLLSFIQKAREDFRNPGMAFVCGSSAAPPARYPHVKHVREAQQGVDLPAYAWVDCDSVP